MKYTEIKGDLFTVPKNFHLAHCIASDLHMGAGIAVEFDKRFNLRGEFNCFDLYTNPCFLKHPTCIRTNHVFNLITKSKSTDKPTYASLKQSLVIMKNIIDLLRMRHMKEINRLAMPKIGCGLDRLKWVKVKKIIHEVFDGMDIEIRVYYL